MSLDPSPEPLEPRESPEAREPAPEGPFWRARLLTLAATVVLLPVLVAVTVMPIGMIVGVITTFAFLPGSTLGTVLTYVSVLIPLAGIAVAARYVLKRSGWRRPLGIVLVLYVALALPLLPVTGMVLLSEAGLLHTPEPVSMHSEEPPWFPWAYLLVGAVLLTLVAVESLALARARRGRDERAGSGWGGVVLAALALLVAAAPMTAVSYESAARETADGVAEDVADIGELKHPLTVLDDPEWGPWWMDLQLDSERYRVDYHREDGVHLEVYTVPLESEVVECWEEPEESDCEMTRIRVPELGDGELRAALNLDTPAKPIDTSTIVYLEVPDSDRMVMLLPGIDQSRSFLQGRVRFDVSERELLELAEGLYQLEPDDTEAAYDLALAARLAW